MFRKSSSVALERLAASVARRAVVRVHPLPPMKLSLCSGSSDGSEAEKSTSRHRLGSSGIERFTVKVAEEQGSTLISMLKKRQKGRWFESIPEYQILRESSSVFRAPCSFGYKEVGGSNPSSPTSLTRGSHPALIDKWRKRASIQMLKRITGLVGEAKESCPWMRFDPSPRDLLRV